MEAILSRASGIIIALTGRDEARTWSQLDKQRGLAWRRLKKGSSQKKNPKPGYASLGLLLVLPQTLG
jgi:hypothetical protein